MSTENKERGKRSKAFGVKGEEKAEKALGKLGIVMIEKIGTPVKLIRKKKLHGFLWWRVKWGEKVSADRMGMIKGSGRRVLIEVKASEKKRNLVWSDLKPHQPGRLSMNVDYGGISLLVWVRLDVMEVNIMRWPIEGFRFRKGITPEQADAISIHSLSEVSCGNV